MKSNATMSSNGLSSRGRCLRCRGLLVQEWFDDLWWGKQDEGLRCVNCGHRTDEQEQRRCELKLVAK